MRECGCREYVVQCEHYNGRVLRFRNHEVSIVVELEEEWGLHHTQLSTCHSVVTAGKTYARYREELMNG